MLNRRLAELASSLFCVPIEELSRDSAVGTLDAWDSLGHLRLILEIEKAFGIQFETRQIPEMTSLGQIQLELERRGLL